MKILLLAGEESGVLYANQLKARLAEHDIRGYGDYGFQTADLAVMGFGAVVRRLFYFLRVKRVMEHAICDWQPDVVVTIDYPGMNLKLAAFAKARGIRTVHIVCPQVWAWKAGRIPKIEASLDRLCCFFPFEPKLFKPGFATFVGHPLVEDFAATPQPAAREKGLVALLPGSRLGEIDRILPTMLAALKLLPQVHAVIPAANAGGKARIEELLKAADNPPVTVQLGGARELLLKADCAMVASGTATLEAALARCPTVLVYRVSAFLAWLGRKLIKGIRHIGLINIVWEKTGEVGAEPMPELIQEDFTPARTAAILTAWLTSPAARQDAVSRLDATARVLKTGASAFTRMVDVITHTNSGVSS